MKRTASLQFIRQRKSCGMRFLHGMRRRTTTVCTKSGLRQIRHLADLSKKCGKGV